MSASPAASGVNLRVECLIPILNVRNLPASIRFYTEVLGFRVDWGDEDGSEMASVSRSDRSILLCGNGQGQAGTWIWIGVDDIAPLFEAYTARGVKVLLEPTNFHWAYEMRIEDPDGHVLRFGSEPREERC